MDLLTSLLDYEYCGVAEPPVQCGESPKKVVWYFSYLASAGFNPYTSLMERSLNGSMLTIVYSDENVPMFRIR